MFCLPFISFVLLAFKGTLWLEGYPTSGGVRAPREGQCVSGDLQCALEEPRPPARAAEGGGGKRCWVWAERLGGPGEEGCAVGVGESGHPQRPL